MCRVLLTTNASGYQIDKCLEFRFFKESIAMIVSDRQCGALEVARNHQVDYVDLAERDSNLLNARMLDLAVKRDIDYVISPGFTRIFRSEFLKYYERRIFNCHPSILPAFRGFYDTRDTRRRYPARHIFDRVMDFGSRVAGNTIHLVTNRIDEGYPIIVSTLNIPYDEAVKFTRHRLFIQECQCLLQFVSWLKQDRLYFDMNGRPAIKDARFDATCFAPNLEETSIVEFDLEFPF